MILNVIGILILCLIFLRFLIAMVADTGGQRVGNSFRWLLPGITAIRHINFLAVARRAGRNYLWKGLKVK